MQNSFESLATWIRGEQLDLKAMMEAVDKRDEVEGMKTKLENKKKSDSTELDKLSAGKKTMGTLLKGASGKQDRITNLQNSIAQTEKDVENYDVISKMVSSYLGEQVIPEFKGSKMGSYYKILKRFSMLES